MAWPGMAPHLLRAVPVIHPAVTCLPTPGQVLLTCCTEPSMLQEDGDGLQGRRRARCPTAV